MIAAERQRENREEEGGNALPALVARWRAGDGDAFSDIVERFQGPLLSYTTALVGNVHDAQDAVQETWLRAHKSLHQLREAPALWVWLRRIAHNSAVDAAKQARRRGIPTDPALMEEMDDNPGAEEESRATPEIPLHAIVRAIEGLPDTYRETAVYYYLQEWPYEKIALTLGIEPATARQRISRAGKMLRAALPGAKETECHDM